MENLINLYTLQRLGEHLRNQIGLTLRVFSRRQLEKNNGKQSYFPSKVVSKNGLPSLTGLGLQCLLNVITQKGTEMTDV